MTPIPGTLAVFAPKNNQVVPTWSWHQIRQPHIREYEAGESGANFTSVQVVQIRVHVEAVSTLVEFGCGGVAMGTIIGPWWSTCVFVAGHCTGGCHPPQRNLPDEWQRCEAQRVRDVKPGERRVVPRGQGLGPPQIRQPGRGAHPRVWLGTQESWHGQDVADWGTFSCARGWRATTTREVLSGLLSWGLSSSLL